MCYELGGEADTPLSRVYLPLAQQATVEMSGQIHFREAARQLMIVVQSYTGSEETDVSKSLY